MNTTTMFDIRNPFSTLNKNRNRNMVFYGRVSTEHEAQLSALENQIQWYDDQAKNHPNWNVLNKYIDEGITGTQAKKRPAFMKMIEDAKQGDFDLIVTREVCRFARNTVDTLVMTRELKNIGVEVYFVEDNIWTMDGDGELRLTIMATLAQEESRKVSERVKAGQQISRENGTIYGCGNILGYDRVDGTYVINEEQAETVRLIYNMYMAGEMGAMKIANELTRMGKLNASGKVKWAAGQVTRILSNKTYAGYMEYGKSFSNNYLEQRRVNNYDRSTYMEKKCDFEPIISEEDWNKCQEIKKRRLAQSFNGEGHARHGKKETKDLWTSKLRCSCGYTFRKNRWHKNKNCDWSYGYQCYNQLNNGSAKKHRELGQDDTGYCDQRMIADWKLELMAKTIMKTIWIDKKDIIIQVCEQLKECYQKEPQKKRNLSNIDNSIFQLKKKKDVLIEMRTDGEISKEEFSAQKSKIDERISQLELEKAKELISQQDVSDCSLDYDAIESALTEMIDFDKPKVDRDILSGFVGKVVPQGENHYIWYMNLGNKEPEEFNLYIEGTKKSPIVNINEKGEKSPLHSNKEKLYYDISNCKDLIEGSYGKTYLSISLVLHFEEAYDFRKHLGQYVRPSQWEDIRVDVII